MVIKNYIEYDYLMENSSVRTNFELEKAIRNVEKLAGYLEIEVGDLAEIIHTGWLSIKPEENEETRLHDTETGEERTREYNLGNEDKFLSLINSFGII